jgi:hypothetical protein
MALQGELARKKRPPPDAGLVPVQLWPNVLIDGPISVWETLHMLRPQIEPVLLHVSLRYVLAIISCASRLHAGPEVGGLDLGVGVEYVPEGLAAIAAERTGAGVARHAAECIGDGGYGTA